MLTELEQNRMFLDKLSTHAKRKKQFDVPNPIKSAYIETNSIN